MVWLIILFIVGIIIEICKQNDNNSTSDSVPKIGNGQEQHNAANEAQHNSFKNLYPFIDLYTYYALEGKRSWTPEKIQFIKTVLSPLNDAEKILLRDRLKHVPNVSLSILIDGVKQAVSNNPAARPEITYVIARMLVIDQTPHPSIERKINDLGHSFGLSNDEIGRIISTAIHASEESYQSGESQQEHQGYEQQTTTNSATEWACEILGLSQAEISTARIQQAYRQKMREYHPDKHQGLPEAIQKLLHEKTQDVNKAKDILLKLANNKMSA
ncbi:J domain-containing protein [Alkanindiges illinoisensis]|uniref:J domain-containing protein n=1 Tax=Alkanindiges illinoisensis TaxID=197183 RepID=UPI000479CDAE|nr:DnaJ domain-containing protein [Alkanindiges illinoisensis]